MKKPLVVAHRGFSAAAPENTVAAINAAITAGADMIELDCHLTRDGRAVIIHDSTLIRTTGRNGFVGEFNYNDLSGLDAGSWFSGDFSGERIPLLDDVLELLKQKVPLLLELKTHSFNRNLPEAVVKAITKTQNTDVILQCFSDNHLRKLKSLSPTIKLHKLVTGNLRLLPFLHLDERLKRGRSEIRYKDVQAVNHNHKHVNVNLVNRLHERGQQIFTWTVNEEKEMRKMISCGVDGIITDKPDHLLALIQGTF